MLKSIQITGYNENIPLNTLLINIAGSFILALIITVFFEVWQFDSDIRLGLTTGLLGAFTTFSTFCKETVGLLNNGNYFSAISYMTVSIILGLGMTYFGIVLARELISKIVNRIRTTDDAESDVE
jgi:CrcB protein